MKLLIDIGNSSLKWAAWQAGQVHHHGRINVNNLNQDLAKQWRILPVPAHIGIACVNSGGVLNLVSSICQTLWSDAKVCIAKVMSDGFGVQNAYDEPFKLGVDRWLAMIAAYRLYETNLCLVSCGTATTIDVVNQRGQHIGGVIAPGLRLMKEALNYNTANLPFNEGQYSQGLANTTEAAIYNGTLLAVCGMIDRIWLPYAESWHNEAKLVLTGGDADLVASYLRSNQVIIEPYLVLQGLVLYLEK